MNKKFTTTVLSLLAVTMLGSSCGLGTHPGMRLFEAEYRVDSVLLFAGAYDESDSVPVAKLWASLAEVPMFPGECGSGIAADANDPLRATLSGDVEVRIVHAGTLLSTAKVAELTLVRAGAEDSLWHPAAGEVAKLAAVASY